MCSSDLSPEQAARASFVVFISTAIILRRGRHAHRYGIYLRHIPASFEDLERYLNTVLQEHRRIFEAFEAKDADAATEAMAIHMDESQKRHFFME